MNPTFGAMLRIAFRSAMAVLIVTALPLSAAAAPLVGAASGLCLDVAGASTNPGAAVQMWSCHGGANQQWQPTAAGELRTHGGTRCLDAYGYGTARGTALVSWACTGQANQRWRIQPNGAIVGEQSGLCLDVYGYGTSPGARVVLWSCHGGANQQWSGSAPPPAPDSRAPTPPSALRIADLACRSATLEWAAASDNVGIAHYDIYHDGQQMATVGGATVRTALTLTPGARWGLYVNARDAAGNVSQASPSLPIQVPPCQTDTQAPTAPAGLRGSVAGTSAMLAWNASTDDVGVAGYDVFRNGNKVGSTTALSHTDSGLAPNTSYQYTVAARDAQNNASPRSVGLSLTSGSACSSAVCSASQAASESDLPWGLAALPDGSLLYSRRDTQDIVRLNPATGARTPLGTVPNVQGTDGEGGLLGIAVTPAFPATDPWVYVYHTSSTDNRIVRLQLRNDRLDTSTLQVLLSGIGRNRYHNGGRLRFGPDGKLYATTGDAQNGDFAQDLDNLAGKVLRLNPDGSRPSDNPFNNYVWSYGHRNPQGLAFDSQGRLWEQEFGNVVMDETNLIQKGGNYGWPACEGTSGLCNGAGYIAPKFTYPVAEASCSGLAVVRDVVYIACQRGARIYRHAISGTSLVNSQVLFSGTYGRLRTVEPSIDGGLWLTTTNTPHDSVPNNSDEKIIKVNLGN